MLQTTLLKVAWTQKLECVKYEVEVSCMFLCLLFGNIIGVSGIDKTMGEMNDGILISEYWINKRLPRTNTVEKSELLTISISICCK